MSLLTTIEADLRESLKARDEVRTGTLRMLKTNLKNTAIAKMVREDALAETDAIAVVRQEIKKRKEAVEAFRAGGRAELSQKEAAELAILEKYLPAQLGEAEITKLIADTVAESALTAPFQFGALMGAVVKKVAGRADGSVVKGAVEAFIKAHS